MFVKRTFCSMHVIGTHIRGSVFLTLLGAASHI